MRRRLSVIGYLGVMLLLAMASRGLWLHRFVPAPGCEPLELGYVPAGVKLVTGGNVQLPQRGGELQMSAAEPCPWLHYQWLKEPPAKYVHVSLEAGCEGLVVGGSQTWDDGRVIMRWRDENGNFLKDFLPLWSGRGKQVIRFHDMVLPFERKGGLPLLMIENLGSAGQMTVKSLTVQPVVERPWIKWAAAVLAVAWLAVTYAALRSWVARNAWWRTLAAAGLCLGFSWYAAFPGPWMPLQPLLGRFAVMPLALPEIPPPAKPAPASEPGTSPEAVSPPPPVEAKTVEPPPFPSAAKGPEEHLSGSAVRWLVANLPGLKIYVHFFAFAGLAAALAFLTGTRRAAYVAGALGFLSEFCEWAFGFGVDWGDAEDLVMDATAVLAGMIFWKLVSKWLVKRWGLRLG